MTNKLILGLFAICTMLGSTIMAISLHKTDPFINLVVDALTESETTQGTKCYDTYSREKDVDIRICSTCCILRNYSPVHPDYYKNCYGHCPFE